MSDDINPNENVGDESNSESKLGEMTSFDQLDRITDDQIRDAKGGKAEQRAEKESTKEAKAEDESGGEGAAVGDTAADAEIIPTFGIDPEKIKPIELSYGEERFSLLPETEVPCKVDGEKKGVPLQELISEYSGKTAWDKRFNDMNLEKQSFKKEQRQWSEEKAFVEEKINKFYELSQSDPIIAFDFLCEISGKDPVEFQKNFRENLSKEFETYYNMDEFDRKEFDLSERERHLDRKRTAETDRVHKAELSKAQQTKIQSALDTYQINQDRYFDVVDELRKAAPNASIEPVHVVRYERALMAQKIVKEIRPEKASDTKVLGELAAVMVQNPEFGEDDLKGILAEIWKDEPSQASKDLSRKVLKNQSQTKPGSKPQKEQVFWNFDQV